MTVRSDLLALARSSHLQAPDEPLSSFFARLLREALEARDREADQLYPPTIEEEALSERWLRASVQDLDNGDQGKTTVEKRERRGRRRARVA